MDKLVHYFVYLMCVTHCTPHIIPSEGGRAALLIVDVQYCFLPGGSLAVDEGHEIIPIINDIRTRLMTSFDLVVLSQDWHCPDHVSFASQHQGYGVLDSIDLYYSDSGDLCETPNVTNSYTTQCTGDRHKLSQVLWPDHCVKHTSGAGIHANLITRDDDVIIRKGHRCNLDSYSVFYDNGRFGETNLREVLEENNIKRMFITGLATDYCVYWSAKDAKELGLDTFVVLDATRGVAPVTTEMALQDMRAHNISLIQSKEMGRAQTSAASQSTISWLMLIFFVSLA